MWNQLQDTENADEVNSSGSGIIKGFRKYKSFIYILLIILVIFGLFISYYELNDKQVDFELDCNDLNEKCLSYKYPEFKPHRLRIVDVNTENNNILIRSSVPLFNGIFSEDLLRKHIKTLMESSNINYNDNMPLYIISFLRNDAKEGCCYTSQRCYVKDANIVNYVILGHSEDPYDVDKKELVSLNWDTDKLLERVDELKNKFNSMKNTIFVIHCRRGRDRTGEFVAAYRMILKKHDFDAVVKSNEEIGKVKEPYLKMQKWLCLYLEKVLGYTNIGCYDFR
ncbi:protein phosphatase, putative [Plasmodium ovale]|uniref:Protein phosphatase, putative n=1 Tax=Plasmodium ovale TaxID=36330 RepID=A0A1D3TI20_PLAOA|nr:protein phosphatase, putative [Plasmodium ovale]